VANVDPKALARLFENKPEKRKKLHDKPEEAAREAGLTGELAKHFAGLKRPQREALTATWDKLSAEEGLQHDLGDGVTVNFF
jgi:hypothetical protein